MIKTFIDKIFGARQKLSLKEFKDVNVNVSSEMFVSIMQVLHNTLPCTKNFFQLK